MSGTGSRALPWAIVLVVIGGDALLCIRSPGDLDRFLINAILALSAFATLHARMLSLANAGFMALGAYASAILAVKVGLPVALSIPFACIFCGIVALVIGLPVLRLTDVYLAIATLGFGEVVRILIILLPGLTGGPTGANLSTGFAYDAMHKTSPAVIALFLLFLVYLFWSLSRSKTGRAFRAIRERPEAASTMGIDVVAHRSLAFLLSAVIAGAAGAFYAHSVGSLDNGDFRFTRAVDILSYAVVGGSGQWFGPLLGAGLLTALPLFLRESLGASIGFLRDFAQLPNIVTGLALLLVIVFMPGGLAQAFPRRPRRPAGGRRQAAIESGGVPGAGHADAVGQITSSAGSGASLLEVRGLSKGFGGVDALSGLSLRFAEGLIHGLIGPNGAGKTTFINLVSGLASPSSGEIVWRGRPIHGHPPHAIARAGLARTYQSIRLFAEMSVLDNVIVGHHARIRTSLLSTWLRFPRERREEAAARAEAAGLLQRLGLSGLADQAAGTLAYGDQRRVEVARALALHPRLLLLDEPAAGMNEVETERLGRFLLDLKAKGYTLIVVEHHMDLIMRVCDRIVVLNFGRAIAEGTPAEVAGNEQVREAYLGRD